MTKPMFLTCVMLVVAAIASVSGQATSDVQAINEIEQRLAKAWVDRDEAAIDAILATEWSVTDGSGRVLTKQQVMQESFGSTDRRVDRMISDDVKVRVYGETAVATGRTQATGSYRGTSASVVLRFTDVFVRRDRRWQAVASHGSTVAP